MSEEDAKKFLEILSASALASTIPLTIILKHLIDENIVRKEKILEIFESQLTTSHLSRDSQNLIEPIWRGIIEGLRK